MKVAACQLPEIVADVRTAVSLARTYAERAASEGACLVSLPECFLQGYDLEPAHLEKAALDLGGAAFREVLEALADVTPVVVLGVIERERELLYNTAVAIKRGRMIARYRKIHLLAPERAVFTAGREPAVFEVEGMRVGIAICNDLRSPEVVERTVLAGATVLVSPCSNRLPRAAAEEWRFRHHEIRARLAVAHGIWIVTADIVSERDGWISYGPSAIIDPRGEIVGQVPLMTEGLAVADIGNAVRATDPPAVRTLTR